MDNIKKIGILMIALAVVLAMFGFWLKTYNDKLATVQVNETGSCYLPDGTCLHATSDSMLYVTFGIAVFLAAVGVYLLARKNEKTIVVKKAVKDRVIEKPVESVPEAPQTLGPESKQVFDIIAEANGAILQGELIAKSGMDKVKVSRILDKLEMQGLVERRRHGMSNLVVLKKK